jgi:hypothetical protein
MFEAFGTDLRVPPLLITSLQAAVCIAGLLVVRRWARAHAADLAAASAFSDRFAAAAQRLIGDPETPPSVVVFAERLAERVGRPRLARSVVRRRPSLVASLRRTEAQRRFARDLRALTPERRTDFADLVAAGVFSSAAADPVFAKARLKAARRVLTGPGRGGEAVCVQRASALAVGLTAALDGATG